MITDFQEQLGEAILRGLEDPICRMKLIAKLEERYPSDEECDNQEKDSRTETNQIHIPNNFIVIEEPYEKCQDLKNLTCPSKKMSIIVESEVCSEYSETESALDSEEKLRLEELARLRAEEEAKQQEEIHQEIRRQLILQQDKDQAEQKIRQQEKQRLQEEAEKCAIEVRQVQQSAFTVNPKLVDTKLITGPAPVPLHLPAADALKAVAVIGQDHLRTGTVSTGQVMEKRNLWSMRSASNSMERLPTTSPAPRRRKMDWGSREEESEDGTKPGSSFSQKPTGSVWNISKGFLAKSKPSSAVTRHEERWRPKAQQVNDGQGAPEEAQGDTYFRAQGVKTNKMTETGWGRGQKTTLRLSTPEPSSNIGGLVSENKIAKVAWDEKTENSSSSGQPKPTMKLVNVTVERPAIHISKNAHTQIASFMVTDENEETLMKSQNSKINLMKTSNESSTPTTHHRSMRHGGKGESCSQGDEIVNVSDTDTAETNAAKSVNSAVDSLKSEGAQVTSIKSDSAQVTMKKSDSGQVTSKKSDIAQVTSMKSGSAQVASMISDSVEVSTLSSESVKIVSMIDQADNTNVSMIMKSESANCVSEKSVSFESSAENCENVIVVSKKSESVPDMRSKIANSAETPKPEEANPEEQEDGVQAPPSFKSITSQITSCSSSVLPVLLRVGCFDHGPHSSPTLKTSSDTSLPIAVSWCSPVDRMKEANKTIDQANNEIEQTFSKIDEVVSHIELIKLDCPAQKIQKSFTDSTELTSAEHIDKNLSQVVSSTSCVVKTESNKSESVNTSKETKETTNDEQQDILKCSDTRLDNVILKDTCRDATMETLNDMFDELVSEQNTLDLLEVSEPSGTIKRSHPEPVQKMSVLVYGEEINTRSVKTDSSAPGQEDPEPIMSVLTVPQSPSEIRKMFQQPDAFQKSFIRASETECSQETFPLGKVRQSRDNFLRQAKAGSLVVDTKMVLHDSTQDARRTFLGLEASQEENSCSQEIRQAKLEELAVVRASRAVLEREVILGQQVESAGARERKERKQELMLMSSLRQEQQGSKQLDKETEELQDIAKTCSSLQEPNVQMPDIEEVERQRRVSNTGAFRPEPEKEATLEQVLPPPVKELLEPPPPPRQVKSTFVFLK